MTQQDFMMHQQAQADKKSFIQLLTTLALPANNFPADIREPAEKKLRDLIPGISIEPKTTTIKTLT
jgi:hypothetical protein